MKIVKVIRVRPPTAAPAITVTGRDLWLVELDSAVDVADGR
jgi:hypothetical protein